MSEFLRDRNGRLCNHPRTTACRTPPPENVTVTACFECGGIWWKWAPVLRGAASGAQILDGPQGQPSDKPLLRSVPDGGAES